MPGDPEPSFHLFRDDLKHRRRTEHRVRVRGPRRQLRRERIAFRLRNQSRFDQHRQVVAKEGNRPVPQRGTRLRGSIQRTNVADENP